MSDAALVLRARGGDELAFRRLIGRYKHVYEVAVRRDGLYMSGHEKEDLRQESLLGLAKAVRDWQPAKGPFGPFARKCIKRQMLTGVTTAGREKHRVLTLAGSLSLPASVGEEDGATAGDLIADPRGLNPADVLEAKEEFRAFKHCLADALTPLERATAIGIAEGESYAAIAERLGCDEKRIDNARQRVTRKVGAALEAAA